MFCVGTSFLQAKSVDLFPALPSIIVRDMKKFEKYYGSFYFPGKKKNWDGKAKLDDDKGVTTQHCSSRPQARRTVLAGKTLSWSSFA